MKQEIIIVVVRVCRPCQNGRRCLSVLLVDVGIDVDVDVDAGIGIEIETIVVGSISYLFLSYNAPLPQSAVFCMFPIYQLKNYGRRYKVVESYNWFGIKIELVLHYCIMANCNCSVLSTPS